MIAPQPASLNATDLILLRRLAACTVNISGFNSAAVAEAKLLGEMVSERFGFRTEPARTELVVVA